MQVLVMFVFALLAVIAGANLSLPALFIFSGILIVVTIVAWALFHKEMAAFVGMIAVGAVTLFLVIMWVSYLFVQWAFR